MTLNQLKTSTNKQTFFAAKSIWVLLFGICLLMLGNGLQGSLLGLRASQEGFGRSLTGFIMSGFFLGFLAGARWTPQAVRRVGHIRVFAAMVSIASVSILIHALFIDPLVWGVMRFMTGLCFAGIFVVSESWLNDRATNTNRGQLLGIYMVTTSASMAAGQLLLNTADPRGTELFILASVLISLAVVPMLLTATPVPQSDETHTVGLKRLYNRSPLGIIGTFVAGITNGSVFGMGAVYAHEAGFSTAEVSLFMSVLILGGAVLQYPIGMLSDGFDRRAVITITAFGTAGLAALACWAQGWPQAVYLPLIGLFGGSGLSIHSLCLAYTNDFLHRSEMVGASSDLVMALGAGSIIGPPIVGMAMDMLGPSGFFWWLSGTHLSIGLLAIWRILKHRGKPEEQGHYVAMPAQASSVATAAAEEISLDQEDEAGSSPNDL